MPNRRFTAKVPPPSVLCGRSKKKERKGNGKKIGMFLRDDSVFHKRHGGEANFYFCIAAKLPHNFFPPPLPGKFIPSASADGHLGPGEALEVLDHGEDARIFRFARSGIKERKKNCYMQNVTRKSLFSKTIKSKWAFFLSSLLLIYKGEHLHAKYVHENGRA